MSVLQYAMQVTRSITSSCAVTADAGRVALARMPELADVDALLEDEARIEQVVERKAVASIERLTMLPLGSADAPCVPVRLFYTVPGAMAFDRAVAASALAIKLPNG